MFTVIDVPFTVTIAVPLPVTPLPAFGFRLALTPPSARAGPAARANIAAAPSVALAIFLVSLSLLLGLTGRGPVTSSRQRGTQLAQHEPHPLSWARHTRRHLLPGLACLVRLVHRVSFPLLPQTHVGWRSLTP